MSLLQIPDTHLVALVVDPVDTDKQALQFYRLCDMPEEDREILDIWLHQSGQVLATLKEDQTHIPEIILGEPLGKHCIKWTKGAYASTNIKKGNKKR